MAKKTLKQKINDLFFWTIIFFIFYIITAYLLETSWLKIVLGLPNIYEILKDGLTITATFLAPTSALLLFSDWREQHVEKKLDDIAHQLVLDIQDIQLYIVLSYYRDAVKVDTATYRIVLVDHPTKGSILDMRRIVQNNLELFKSIYLDNHAIFLKLQELLEVVLILKDILNILKFSEKRIQEYKADGELENKEGIEILNKTIVKNKNKYLINMKKLEELNLEIKTLLNDFRIKLS